jgi:hypothetical protein
MVIGVIILDLAVMGVIGFFGFYPDKAPISWRDLSLAQLVNCIGGLITALILLVGSSIWMNYKIITSDDDKLSRTVRRIAAAVIVIIVYAFGFIGARNIGLNTNKGTLDANISALYSWTAVGDNFIRFMYDNRNVPIGEAMKRFGTLVNEPSTTSLPPPHSAPQAPSRPHR